MRPLEDGSFEGPSKDPKQSLRGQRLGGGGALQMWVAVLGFLSYRGLILEAGQFKYCVQHRGPDQKMLPKGLAKKIKKIL